MLVTNLLGAAVIIVIALWVMKRYVYGPVLERFIIFPMSAFVWYKTVITVRLGQAVAEGLLALLILPGTLWLVIWVYSLARRIWLAARLLLPARRDTASQVSGMQSELRKITGRRPPRIRVEKRLDIPRTEAFLPFRWACVIRLPQHWVEDLSHAELISVVAHEAVHAREHARRMWWLEFLSWLTITGPGLLTLLLDFAAMEHRADEVALRWTGDRRSAVGALTHIRKGQWKSQAAGPRRASSTGGSGLAAALARTRTAFFAFWTSQPGEEAVSLQERENKIAGYSI
jgi:hypothetical protein